MSNCTIPACDKVAFSSGLCSAHYYRQRRHGSTDDPRPSADARFWTKVTREGAGGCWLWLAKRNHDGYGIFWFERRGWFAHRWAYEQAIGLVSAGLELDHLCRVRACVNPDHLEAVTPQVNVGRSDSPLGRNARKTHCKRGHPFDEANTYRFGPDGRQRLCKACGKEQRHARYLASRQSMIT